MAPADWSEWSPATPATPATPPTGQSRQNALGQWSTEYFIAGATFEILDDYILEESVGQGSYGTVASAVGRETGEAVAVKKVESVFDHVTFSRRTLREVRIVRLLSHENIVNINSMFIPATKETYSLNASCRKEKLRVPE